MPFSTDKSSRPLDVAELHRLRWLLGGGVALTSIACSLLLELNTAAVLAVCLPLILLALVRPSLPARIPKWLHRAAFPLILGGFALDYIVGRDLVTALIRLDLVLLTYRACSYRQRRDDLQLIVLGLFLIVATGVLTATLAFAFYLALFIGLSLGLLLVRVLAENAEAALQADLATASLRDSPPQWLQLIKRAATGGDWRATAIWITLCLAVIPLAAGLFLAIPRFELANTLFIERLLTRKNMTGFTDTLRFGEVSNIMQDTSVALRVDIADRSSVPDDLYWRMIVMDEYSNQSFRASNQLQASAFGPAGTYSRIDGRVRASRRPRLRGDFYLEPGVSRYLPTTGPFRAMAFTEAQSLRISTQLQIFQLNRDPTTMKAYRVGDMITDPRLEDPNYQPPARSTSPNGVTNGPKFLELPLAQGDLERLDAVLAEIRTTVADGSVESFARETGRWLRRQHSYSLSMALPPGEGDPLTRWLVSREPGHCELFAGSLTLLARRAGHPARIVGGFVGGEWNDDYLIVRNANAHAWCEIYDGAGGWLRIDPSRAEPGEPSLNGSEPNGAQLVEAADTWGSWADRLRMLWYRRVVNFDRSDQQALVQNVAGKASLFTVDARAIVKKGFQDAIAWLRSPWDTFKVFMTALGLGVVAVVILGIRVLNRWQQARSRGLGAPRDRTRRVAGYWLHQLRKREAVVPPELQERLERIRFGSEQQWPDPRSTFQSARKAFRRAKRSPQR